jgi:post-segregation antitoxin (ccd killing protein)
MGCLPVDGGLLCYVINMAEKKAVLNVTISESLAAEVRRAAKLEHTTISSVVERALAKQVSWEIKRLEGLAAIDAYYQEHGYPTAEQRAASEARVDDEERLIDEARARNAARGGFRADEWGAA